jgi:hypothetical protein
VWWAIYEAFTLTSTQAWLNTIGKQQLTLTTLSVSSTRLRTINQYVSYFTLSTLALFSRISWSFLQAVLHR